MNTVSSLFTQVISPLPYSYYSSPYFMVNKTCVLKLRLYVKPDIFVQIYRNDEYDSTNFTLISAGQRIYARDQVRSVWHRHPTNDPISHNYSPNGSTPVTLTTFLSEVDEIIKRLGIVTS